MYVLHEKSFKRKAMWYIFTNLVNINEHLFFAATSGKFLGHLILKF